ncbi:9721_t:CDS:1 [Diversispora eburnea]|uniref:9721_t:CDS:1 n=1 Tax=Diversispora eburnea TaxID=1213867 RepID=A0A9N8YPQ6_9GLOM|nr:9721_t:CDS:1 [Diversispora eburnea]
MPKTSEKKTTYKRRNVRNVHLYDTPQFKETLKQAIDKNFKKTYPNGMSVETTLPLDQLLAPCKKTRGKRGRITRPQNAFILYRKDIQAKIKEVNPDAKFEDVSKIVGELWKTETNQRKNNYILLSNLCCLVHQDLFPNYKFKPRPKEDGNDKSDVNEQSEFFNLPTNLDRENQNILLSSFDINSIGSVSPIPQDAEDEDNASVTTTTTTELSESIPTINIINNCNEQNQLFSTGAIPNYEGQTGHLSELEYIEDSDFLLSSQQSFDNIGTTNNYEIQNYIQNMQNLDHYNIGSDPLPYTSDENSFLFTTSQNGKSSQEYNDYSIISIPSSSTQNTIPTTYPQPITPITSNFINDNNNIVTTNPFLYDDSVNNNEIEYLSDELVDMLANSFHSFI